MALIGILFLGFRLHAYWQDLDISQITPTVWIYIAMLSVIYGSANFLLAVAWRQLLENLGVKFSSLGSIRLYGMSQLAKYVPGNIFHLAGRQAYGMAAGIEARALAKSILWELGLIALAGAQFCWLIASLFIPTLPQTASVFLLLSSVILIGAILSCTVGRKVGWAFLCQILFLLISSTVFVALLILTTGERELTSYHLLTIGGCYIVAWLVGLITPGAPAGVGVREMILLLLLNGLVTETDLFMAVLLGRLVTVVGDLLFFITASSISAKFSEFEINHASR